MECLAAALACNSVLGIPEAQRAIDAGASARDGGALDGDSAVDAATSDAPPPILSDGGACPAGRKACGAYCVSVLDPATGCGGASCGACAFAHATAICVNAQCAVSGCELGFTHCSASASDGCEVDTRTDPANCGDCRNACPPGWACGGSVCACAGNENCGDAGVCDRATGVCSCSGQGCGVGASCDPDGTCTF